MFPGSLFRRRDRTCTSKVRETEIGLHPFRHSVLRSSHRPLIIEVLKNDHGDPCATAGAGRRGLRADRTEPFEQQQRSRTIRVGRRDSARCASHGLPRRARPERHCRRHHTACSSKAPGPVFDPESMVSFSATTTDPLSSSQGALLLRRPLPCLGTSAASRRMTLCTCGARLHVRGKPRLPRVCG